MSIQNIIRASITLFGEGSSIEDAVEQQEFSLSLQILQKLAISDEPEVKILEKLKVFFAARWNMIASSNLDYTVNPLNPMNQLCVKIANDVVNTEGYSELSACRLLLPTVERMAGVSVSYGKHDPIKYATEEPERVSGSSKEIVVFHPENFLLTSHDNSVLLDIDGFYDYGIGNTKVVFKQYQLDGDSTCYFNELLEQDYAKIQNISPEFRRLYDALFYAHKQKFVGETIGKGLTDFYEAVYRSSVNSNGEETQADTQSLANRLLKMWQVYRGWDETTRQRLKSVTEYGISANLFQVLVTLFSGHPYCSKDMTADEKANIERGKYATCTQLLSSDLGNLVQSTNKRAEWLFEHNLISGKQISTSTSNHVAVDLPKAKEEAMATLATYRPKPDAIRLNAALYRQITDIVQSKKSEDKQLRLDQLKVTVNAQLQAISDTISTATADYASAVERAKANTFLQIFNFLQCFDPTDFPAEYLSALLEMMVVTDGALDQAMLMQLLANSSEQVQTVILSVAKDAIQDAFVSKKNITQMLEKLKQYESEESQELLFFIFKPFIQGNVDERDIQDLLNTANTLSPLILQGILDLVAPPVETGDELLLEETVAQTSVELLQQLNRARQYGDKLIVLQNYYAQDMREELSADQLSWVVAITGIGLSEHERAEKFEQVYQVLAPDFQLETHFEDIHTYLAFRQTQSVTPSFAKLLDRKYLDSEVRAEIQLDGLIATYTAAYFTHEENATAIQLIKNHFVKVFEANFETILPTLISVEPGSIALFIDIADYQQQLLDSPVIDFTFEQYLALASLFREGAERNVFVDAVIEKFEDQLTLEQLFSIGFEFEGFVPQSKSFYQRYLDVVEPPITSDNLESSIAIFSEDTQKRFIEFAIEKGLKAEVVQATKTLHTAIDNPEPGPKLQPQVPVPFPTLGTLSNLTKRYEKFINHEQSNMENAKAILQNYVRPGYDCCLFGFLPDPVLRVAAGHINRSTSHLVAVKDTLTREHRTVVEMVAAIVDDVKLTSNSQMDSFHTNSSLYRRLDYLMRIYGDGETLENILHHRFGNDEFNRVRCDDTAPTIRHL